jgi:hypothetical protein
VPRTPIVILNHVDGCYDLCVFVSSLFAGESLAGTEGLGNLDFEIVINGEICILCCFEKPVC